MVDTKDLKSFDRKVVPVRVRPRAQKTFLIPENHFRGVTNVPSVN